MSARAGLLIAIYTSCAASVFLAHVGAATEEWRHYAAAVVWLVAALIFLAAYRREKEGGR